MSLTGPGKPTEISPEELRRLAGQAHDRWVKGMLAAGWRLGPEFTETAKNHPFLVPFDQLPQVEQARYYQVGLAALEGFGPDKAVAPALGSDPQAPLAGKEEEISPNLKKAGLGEILNFWRTWKVKTETLPAVWFRALGQHTLRLGEPLLAYDMITVGLKRYPADVRLRQLLALALLRAGSAVPALNLLENLYNEGHRDEETLGLLARVHKDLAQATPDSRMRIHHWLKAKEIYGLSYRETGGYWSGINAATLACLLGEMKGARALALQVQGQCQQQLRGLSPEDGEAYWVYATLGEAALIQGHLEEAFNWYAQAGQVAGRRYGDLASTRRNAWLLWEALGIPEMVRETLKKCLRIPRVAVFAGHMIDQPGRPEARFPPELEEPVAREIRRVLEQLDIGIGYASAACGSDIIFLEALLARKGEIHIVLPIPEAVFRKTSVDLIPQGNWGHRFSRVLKAATQVVVACEHRVSGSPVTYEYANLIQDGLAILKAKLLDTDLVPLAVWDGRPGDGPGGTGSLVKYWRRQGRPPELIDLTRFQVQTDLSDYSTERALIPTLPSPEQDLEALPQEIVAVLFADVVGFSQLKEEEVPVFLKQFMGAVEQYLTRFERQPLWVNTWGDALHCVFATVKEAGQFALGLRDWVSRTDWQTLGLPKELLLRISLHAGPVYIWNQTALAGLRYSGSHVSRAARIEPITPPNQVYASQEFAALATSQGVADFVCEYVGQITLPKQAGVAPLYLVRRPVKEEIRKPEK